MIADTLAKESLKMAGVQQKHENDLLELRNVVGVCLGHNIKKEVESEEPVITVLVNHKMDPSEMDKTDMIPKKLGDFETDVVEVGDIFAGGHDVDADADEYGEDVDNFLDADDSKFATIQAAFSPSLTRRMRPVYAGFSVGHYKITAGTIGTGCYDSKYLPGRPPKYYILSNNHVLANSNNARIGDPILQPGRVDGGRYPRDVIGKLSRFIPIRFRRGTSMPCNYVDAAIAECNLQDVNRQPYWGGHVKRLYTAPKVGEIVQKSGRTTGFTTGKVTNINGTINVNYGGGKLAKFCRQIITTDMSAGGDSGSLVMNRDEGAVGLLFAGSSTRTIINNIYYVQAFLGIRVTEK